MTAKGKTMQMAVNPGNGAVVMGSARRTVRLVNSETMGEILGVSSRTAQRMARDGVIPSVHVGRCLRFDPDEVLDCVMGNRRRQAENPPSERFRRMARA